MKKWLCVICGLIYDEAEGWPDDGIDPGTRWEDVPEDWTCPDCGVGKEDFEMIEMAEEESAPSVVTTPEPAAAVAAATTANEVEQTAARAGGTAADTLNAPIIIIGSGYAGYGAAAAIRRADESADILVLTHDDGADYSKPGLSNALARGKTPADLVMRDATQMATRLKARVETACRVSSIDSDKHEIHSDRGHFVYRKLILATGAEPVRLPLRGDGVGDILSVNSLVDYRVLREQLNKDSVRRISIIGNGLVGCEYANELINQGYEVTVIGLTSWPLDTLMPEAIGQDLQQKLSALGVNWHLENTVESITKQGNTYQLSLANGEQLESDLVLSSVGLRPRTELAITAGIDCNRGILVDEYLQTSSADIFALGDCTEIGGQTLPYIAPITHGLRVLADNVLDDHVSQAVQYPLMPVVVKTPALPLLLLPVAQGVHADWQVEATPSGQRGLLVDAEQKVRGFALSGDLVNAERQQWLDAINAG